MERKKYNATDYAKIIVAKFKKNRNFIGDNLDSLTFAAKTYIELRTQYKSGDDITTGDFYPKYVNFYAMNRAPKDFKKAYTETMVKIRTEEPADLLPYLLSELEKESKVKVRNSTAKTDRIQFSFMTKMMCLIDDTKYPIYDNCVVSIFGWGQVDGDSDKRKGIYQNRYSIIENTYNISIRKPAIKKLLTDFLNIEDCLDMSPFRALDIMIWQLGKNEIKKKKKSTTRK